MGVETIYCVDETRGTSSGFRIGFLTGRADQSKSNMSNKSPTAGIFAGT